MIILDKATIDHQHYVKYKTQLIDNIEQLL